MFQDLKGTVLTAQGGMENAFFFLKKEPNGTCRTENVWNAKKMQRMGFQAGGKEKVGGLEGNAIGGVHTEAPEKKIWSQPTRRPHNPTA